MPKPLGPGSEIEAYCTKCKLDLDHRIIAMDGIKPHKVECLTCRGHHLYRRPKAAAGETASRAAAKRSPAKPKTVKEMPIDKMRINWEKAIAGRTVDEFTPYRIDLSLKEGQLLRHKKFGDGVVAELLEGGKAHVLFESGAKTLVYGR